MVSKKNAESSVDSKKQTNKQTNKQNKNKKQNKKSVQNCTYSLITVNLSQSHCLILSVKIKQFATMFHHTHIPPNEPQSLCIYLQIGTDAEHSARQKVHSARHFLIMDNTSIPVWSDFWKPSTKQLYTLLITPHAGIHSMPSLTTVLFTKCPPK